MIKDNEVFTMDKRNAFALYRPTNAEDVAALKPAGRRIFTQRLRKFLGRPAKK